MAGLPRYGLQRDEASDIAYFLTEIPPMESSYEAFPERLFSDEPPSHSTKAFDSSLPSSAYNNATGFGLGPSVSLSLDFALTSRSAHT